MRLPVRYTASNSPRRTSRTARGNPRPSGLLRGEAMTSLLAARRQHFAAAYALHSRSKSVRFRTPPLPRLISPLWQGTASLCSLLYYVSRSFRVSPGVALRQAALAAISESVSVVDPRVMGQEITRSSQPERFLRHQRKACHPEPIRRMAKDLSATSYQGVSAQLSLPLILHLHILHFRNLRNHNCMRPFPLKCNPCRPHILPHKRH